MTTSEVMTTIEKAIAAHTGDKYDLYDRLSSMGVVWVDQFNEMYDDLQADQDDDDLEDEDSTIEYSE